MSVIDEVCGVKGHSIQSYTVKDVLDPLTKSVVHVYEYRCAQCGKTLDEIAKYKISSRGTARKRKAKENGNNDNAKSGAGSTASQAASETATAQDAGRESLADGPASVLETEMPKADDIH